MLHSSALIPIFTVMKNSKKQCDLASCFLCRLSLPEWIPAIEGNKQTLHFKKGELIFREGDEVKGIYFVYKGTVKVHKKWGDDKEIIIRFAKEGDIFGHRGLGKESAYPISATALEPITVCFITLGFLQTTLKVNHDFTFKLIMFYAEELQESEKKMRNLAHMPVKGRLAYALLLLKEKFGLDANGCIAIYLSRQDIASYIGTTYETVFRMMNELTEEGMITADGKEITILNEPRLVDFTTEGGVQK